MATERVFSDQWGDWKRSCYCGEPRAAAVGKEMTLVGWVHSRRDHGGVIFVDLRDRSGICQIVFRPEVDPVGHEKAKQIRSEDVIAVRGTLAKRSAETINADLATGEVELVCQELRLLNASAVPPFIIEDETDANENTRLKYRYLDLRRPQSLSPLLLRYRMTKLIRDYLDGLGFIDVETPVLTKSTPEGARDYLVPSRIYHGKFYALPQSPQLFKQILMVGGLDRYFQIVKCFRDEDLRADRQPEFTQLDMEMSFVQREDVMQVVEGMISLLFKELKGIELKRPFTSLTYEEAMSRFGSDKPDMRFGLELRDFTDALRQCQARVFAAAIQNGGVVKGIRIPKGGELSRKDLDDMTPVRGDLRRQGHRLDQDHRGGLAVAYRQVFVGNRTKSDRANRRSRDRRRGVVFRRQRQDRARRARQSASVPGRKAGLDSGKGIRPRLGGRFSADGIRCRGKALRGAASSVHSAVG